MPKIALTVCLALGLSVSASSRDESLLRDHLLVTWYGNPGSPRTGVLGEKGEPERAAGLRAQAAAYAKLTDKAVLMAYHLVAVVAQCSAGTDGKWRRRESRETIQALLDAARANGFRLILDVQPGRAAVADEVAALEPFLAEPDVDLALDPEWAMGECEVPGKTIGSMPAADVNAAIDRLETLITRGDLPPKIVMLHQFRLDMLPDKSKIRKRRLIDLVLTMDGFGSQSLKRTSYVAVMRQPLAFAGIKLFYKQDVQLFAPAQVLSLKPAPSVIVYQ